MSNKQVSADASKPVTRTAKSSGSVAQCWAMWDELAGGALVPRGLAVDLAIASGINQFTARTQFQRWFTARKAV